ncbi:hypothetical protein VIBNISOn1_100007 [Vibrio nigripulchritudo SOn1]|uniref:Uncharacterized protein n=1 Tax=Vibrio nigripulchritudo SOn1 TaxID=1238450 RepID=A0AAV2VHN3_9VIBR|nr:hypothetical protein VIBNISOn1_100007 [Vibrio nigripulchritudo SOn1]
MVQALKNKVKSKVRKARALKEDKRRIAVGEWNELVKLCST